MEEKKTAKKARVVATEKFPCGYAVIVDGGSMLPASPFEVILWKMYQNKSEEVRKLNRRIAALENRSEIKEVQDVEDEDLEYSVQCCDSGDDTADIHDPVADDNIE